MCFTANKIFQMCGPIITVIQADRCFCSGILIPDNYIKVSVGSGKGSAVAWGCDLTYDYVKINGDYRS